MSVSDPYHFDTDPDPQILNEWLGITNNLNTTCVLIVIRSDNFSIILSTTR